MDWIATFEALKFVYNGMLYSSSAINHALENHPESNAEFVRNFTKGVIRDTIKIDYIIDSLADKGIEKIKFRTLIILRMGIYSIINLNSVPDYAAVNQSVKLAKKVAKGTEGFINAILRNYCRQKERYDFPVDRLDIKYSISKDIVDLLKSQYPNEIEKILEGLNTINPLYLRVNTLKVSVDKVFDYLTEQGYRVSRIDNSNIGLCCESGEILHTDAFEKGWYSIQSSSAIIAIEDLAPKENSKVLDMCAAPGGKSTAMAELMNNKGEIISCDINPFRLKYVDELAHKLDINIIKTKEMDGTIFNKEFVNAFDYVIADVPCSGIGTISGKPEIRLKSDFKNLDGLYEIQYKILKNAILYAKPGGIIEYSTCTINKKENHEIVNLVKSEYNNVQILENKLILPYNKVYGFYICIMQKDKL